MYSTEYEQGLDEGIDTAYFTSPDFYARREMKEDAVEPWDGNIDELLDLVDIAETTAMEEMRF